MNDRLNKIKGCLLGGAMGDALGYTVEFMSYNQIQNRYGKDGIREYDLVNGKALISDDTQMTLFTAVGMLWWDTRVKNKGLPSNPSYWIYYAYLDWLETQGYSKPKERPSVSWIKDIKELNYRRAPGNTCLSALLSGKQGTMEERINNSKGCGGVMRVAPVALGVENTSVKEVALEAGDVAAITHGHDLGIIPAALLAHIIYSIMKSDEINIKRIIDNSLFDICVIYHRSKYINYFKELITKAINLANTAIDKVLAINELGEGWVAEEAVAIAIYSVLKNNNFEDTIITAVNHNGDSDSTGSIAGNIAGALYGYDQINPRFKENLELKGLMEEIAEDLHNRCPFGEYDNKNIDFNWIRKYMPYY